MNSINVSKAQRDYLDKQRNDAQRRQRVFNQQATPEAAANLAMYSADNPGGSSEVGLSLVASGVPWNDPIVRDLVQTEQGNTETNGPIKTSGGGIWNGLARGLDEFVYDPIKGTGRWGMMGLMAVYESTIGGSGIRAAQQAAQTGRGMFGEDSTLYEQQPFVTQALADVFRDPMATLQSAWQESTTADPAQEAMLRTGNMEFTSNQGGGWFVNSDVAPDVQGQVQQATMELHRTLDGQNLSPNERYRAELEASPDIWRTAVEGDLTKYQASLGAPMTQQGYANRESVGFNVPNLTGANGRGTVWTPYSPGRIAAATVFEPGTQSFSIASGLGDITAQLVADPMNYIGGAWAKSGLKGRMLWGGMDETVKNIRQAKNANIPIAKTLAHGGPGDLTGGAMRQGGLTTDVGRATEYAEDVGKVGEGGKVHFYSTEAVDPKVRKRLGRGDVEQLYTDLPDYAKPEWKGDFLNAQDQIDDLADEYVDAIKEFESYSLLDEPVAPPPGAQTKMDEAAEAFNKTKAEVTEGWEDAKKSAFDRMFAHDQFDEAGQVTGQHPMGAILVDGMPKPFSSLTPEQARKAVADGLIPYAPDGSIKYMQKLKLWTEGAARKIDSWRSGKEPLTPFDPPEEIAEAIRNGRPPAFIKNEKKWLDDYEDVFLDEGAVDAMTTTADATNRLTDGPAIHRVHTQASYGTNHKVRVYGGTLDLTGTKVQGGSKKLRDALEKSGAWGKYGLEGDSLSDDVVRLLREEGIGKVKMTDGRMMIVDDMIGGAKSDALGSRMFFSDGNRTMHGSKVTPNKVNEYIDDMAELGMHGINVDGTIDGAKLSVKEMKALAEKHKGLLDGTEAALAASKADTVLAKGNKPGLLGKYRLSGDHADDLVTDLFKAAKGDGGAARVDRFFNRLERKGVPIPKEVRQAVLDAADQGNKERIRSVLAEWVAKGPGKLELPGGTQYGRLRTPASIIDDMIGTSLAGQSMRGKGPIGKMFQKPWMQRQLALMLPSEGVNLVEDPSGAYSLMVRMLDNYGFNRLTNTAAEGGPETRRLVRVESTPNFAARGARPGDIPTKTKRVYQAHDMESVLERVRKLEPGDKTGAYQIMEDYTAILFTHLKETTKGRIGDDFIKEATTFIKESGDMHIANAERVGQTALGDLNNGQMRINGQSHDFPGMSTLGEMWNGAMHIPDSTLVKRVAGYQTRWGEVANILTSKQVYKVGDMDYMKMPRTGATAKEKARWLEKQDKTMKGVLKRQSKADRNKTVAQRIKEIESDVYRVEIQDRAAYYIARSAMNKVWKPIVLLRGAWTIRILMDDQLRVAASGQSMFNHPIRHLGYALQQPKAFRDAWAKGFVDINGVRVTIDNIDEVQHGLMYQHAMMAMVDKASGKGGFGSRFTRAINRNQSGYGEGLTARLSQFGSDPTARVLATGTGKSAAERQADALAFLMGEKGPDYKILGADGDLALRNLAQMKTDHPKLRDAILRRDRTTLKMHLEEMDAEIHRATGGLVALDNGQGRWMDYGDPMQDITDDLAEMGFDAPMPDEKLTYARPHVLEEGDEEILEIIGKGHGKAMKSPLLKRGTGTLSDAGHDEFRTLVSRKLGVEDKARQTMERTGVKYQRRFPTQTYGPDPMSMEDAPKVRDSANRAVRSFYEMMMSTPSNKLSRSPLFATRYWRSVGERLPFMDDVTREAMLKRARNAGREAQVIDFEKATKKMLGADAAAAKGTLRVEEGVEGVGSLDEIVDMIDEHAKAAGLAEVESVLFNLASKRNVSDSLSLIFPFVEAWGEFITRWGKLMVYGDRNMKNMNRLQQTVNGLRESDPFNPSGDQGFFQENEFGQEVFSYPAGVTKAQTGLWNLLAKITPMTEISPEVADSINATGSVEAMNFASGFIPGFGPVFQVASKAALSDDPRWDGLKNVIAPFGTSGGVAGQFAPAWAKRVMSAMGSEDPQLNSMYMSTVQDVIRTKIAAGAFDGIYTKPEIDAVVREAEEEARNLLFVRAANTWWAPTAPTYKFTEKDSTGKVYTYNQLGQAYRTILYDEASGDESVAFAIFHDRYGTLPTSFTQSRTYSVQAAPVTTDGYRFQRDNPEFFEQYPETAMYLMPGTLKENDEFNYGQYIESLRTSAREQWTGEQVVALNDDMLGDMEWDAASKRLQYLKDAGTDEGRAQHRIQLNQVKEDIRMRHPYWNQPVRGKRVGVSAQERQSEIRTMLDDPNLRGQPVVEAARQYNDARDEVIATLKEQFKLGGQGIEVSSSQRREAVEARAWLRGIAEQIIARFPEFEPMYQQTYKYEVGEDLDGYSDDVVDWYDDGVDFFDLTTGISPGTAPTFTNVNFGG